MNEYAVELEKQYFDEEIKRSFQNVNYSQWERKKSAELKPNTIVKGIQESVKRNQLIN